MKVYEYRILLASISTMREQLYKMSLDCEYEPTEEFLLMAVDDLDEAKQELESKITSELDRMSQKEDIKKTEDVRL